MAIVTFKSIQKAINGGNNKLNVNHYLIDSIISSDTLDNKLNNNACRNSRIT